MADDAKLPVAIHLHSKEVKFTLRSQDLRRLRLKGRRSLSRRFPLSALRGGEGREGEGEARRGGSNVLGIKQPCKQVTNFGLEIENGSQM